MSDLIERLEGLTGPCRECDALIARSIGMCLHPNKTKSGAQSDTGFDCDDCGADSWGNKSKDGFNRRLSDGCPAYTASIDAAMTLVPEGWWLAGMCFCPPDFRTERDKEYSAQIAGPITWGTIDYGGPEEPLYEHESGDAATPAIALCIAVLKATP